MPLPPIVGLTGKKGAGKTTTCNNLAACLAERAKQRGNPARDVVLVPVAYGLKHAASCLTGLPLACFNSPSTKDTRMQELGGKTPRDVLILLGDFAKEHIAHDIMWAEFKGRLLKEMKASVIVVVDDVRFDEEADIIHELGGELWYIGKDRVPGVGNEEQGPGAVESKEHGSEAGEVHATERGLTRHKMERYIIAADGRIEDLHTALESILDEYGE